MRSKPTSRLSAALCALALPICVLLAFPFSEIAPNDDFAYAYSAKKLAETGHFIYCGWSSAMLGWQLVLGSVFIKAFGFSLTTLRFSILLVATATAFVLHRTYVRLGLNERNASFATLAIVLSPLFIPLSFSFMTDVPALFAIVVCLYACLRSMQAKNSGNATLWLIAGMVVSALLGTARQTGWLGMLIIVPSTVWLLRRRLTLFPLAFTWVCSVGFMLVCLRWFSHQLYTTHESTPSLATRKDYLEGGVATFKIFVGLAFFLLPATISFIGGLFRRGQRLCTYSAVLLSVLPVLVLLLRSKSYSAEILRVPPNSFGNYVSVFGTFYLPDIGRRPIQLPVYVVDAISVITLTSLFAFVCFSIPTLATKQTQAPSSESSLSLREVALLLGPFMLSYFALILFRSSRGTLFDRYLLPLLPLFMYMVLGLYQKHVAPKVPAVAWATVIALALYGIASTHDLFATERAQLAAIDELRSKGIFRDQIYGSFGFDGWTQVSEGTYMHTGGITLPASAKLYEEPHSLSHPCGYIWSDLFPIIHAKYAISYDDQACNQKADFRPIDYELWLPPFRSRIYIQKAPPTDQ